MEAVAIIGFVVVLSVLDWYERRRKKGQ